jgi:16S rRNA (uracil1498-N3)-methyltransferase
MSLYNFSAQRLFVDAPLNEGGSVELDRAQANYLLNVLRLGPESHVLVFNGVDGEWLARVSGSGRKVAKLIVERRVRPQTGGPDIAYLFSPLKQARLDYMVQKAVEMGACRLTPVLTRRTQVARINPERMRANAIEAAEQCGILRVPQIDPEIRLDKCLGEWPAGRLLVFCDEDAPLADPCAALRDAQSRATQGISVLIGPEGGFDSHEREQLLLMPNIVRLSLGPRILRADTAAVAALALVQAVLGDSQG